MNRNYGNCPTEMFKVSDLEHFRLRIAAIFLLLGALRMGFWHENPVDVALLYRHGRARPLSRSSRSPEAPDLPRPMCLE